MVPGRQKCPVLESPDKRGKYRIAYIQVWVMRTLEFSVIPEAKPRDNRKRESYNERITHTSI